MFAKFLSFLHSMLVERIDEDKDGYVTVEEMKKWIKHAQKRWIYDDVDRQWKSHDLNGDGVVSWEEYKNATYGYILGMVPHSVYHIEVLAAYFMNTVTNLLSHTCTNYTKLWPLTCRRPWSWWWLQLQADDGSRWEEIQNGWPRQEYECRQGGVHSISSPWGVWPHERHCSSGKHQTHTLASIKLWH